jgi:uncharacterized membrane protein YdjX (TVP38/TMEM64 family)
MALHAARKPLLLIAGLVSVTLVLGALFHDGLNAQPIQAAVVNAGTWGPLAFTTLVAIGVLAFVPGSFLAITGGLLFGPVAGTAYTVIGAISGASLAFLIARYLAADWFGHRLKGSLGVLVHRIEDEGWRFVALVRLVPILPFAVVNYSLGLMRIKLSHYVFTSLLCMIPGVFAYSYLGDAGHRALNGEEAVLKILWGVSMLAALLLIPLLLRRRRSAKTQTPLQSPATAELLPENPG